MSSIEDIKKEIDESISNIKDSIDNSAKALGIDVDSVDDVSQQEAGDDVEDASSGVIVASDYISSSTTPSYGTAGLTSFEQIFEKGKRDLLNEAARNLNTFTKKAINGADGIITDINIVLDEIINEAIQVQASYAASLLFPPNRSDVEDLRNLASDLADESGSVVNSLNSAQAMRNAALRQTGDLPFSVDDGNRVKVDGRFLEVTTDGYAAASKNSDTLSIQAQSPGRASASLTTAGDAVQKSVIENVSYIAICMAINGVAKSTSNKDRASQLFARLTTTINDVMDSFGNGFLRSLQDGMQEIAADAINDITSSVQDKVDAFDLWLAISEPKQETIVRTVSNIGDVPENMPILDSLANLCDLKLESFCDAQGLLEAAKSLDGIIGEIQPRQPALGRARLILQAPDEEVRETVTPADQEANMILVGTVDRDSTQVVARLLRQDISPKISAPVPRLTGVIVSASVDVMVISGLSSNISTLGNIVVYPGSPTQITIRYSEFTVDGANATFTLIDGVTDTISPGSSVNVSGEQRNTFEGAFEPNSLINGGPGRLALAGDGETRQQLDYTGSSFEVVTGHYTFDIDVASTPLSITAPDHKFSLLCRPHQKNVDILYKGSDLLVTGARFSVVGDTIQAVNSDGSINSSFDFTANGVNVVNSASDYTSSGPYLLCIGTDRVGVELAATGSVLTGSNTKLVLSQSFHNGNQTRVTLCRVDNPVDAGSSNQLIKLDARGRFDVGVESVSVGDTKAVDGRILIDGGGSTRPLRGQTTAVSSVNGAAFVQALTSNAPLVAGDEAGFSITVQSGQTTFSTTVESSVVSTKRISFHLPKISGTVETFSTVNVIGTGTVFARELKLGDFIYIDGDSIRKVVEIVSNTELNVDAAISFTGSGNDIYICAPNGNVVRNFSISRRPQETIDFSSIKNIDGEFYSVNLDSPTKFSHGLQEPSVSTTVKIIPDIDIARFANLFADQLASVTPRFDGVTIPPGTTIIRGVFEDTDAQPLLDVFVREATSIILPSGEEISTAPTNTPTDDVYEFNISANPLSKPLQGGDVIEVETTSVIGQLELLFPDTSWTTDFDLGIAELGRLMTIMSSKLCKLLSGRPLNLAITALSIQSEATKIKLALAPISTILSSLSLGLPSSDTISRVMVDFEKSGMDEAAQVLEGGDVISISKMKASSSTKTGRAVEALECIRDKVETIPEAVVVDNMISVLKGKENDKNILAEMRRTFSESSKDLISKRQQAANNLKAESEKLA